MKPIWLPDWKDATAYPGSDASRPKWLWQFLRRNPDYIGDWDRLIRPHYDAEGFDSEAPLQTFRDKYGLMLPPPPEWADADVWMEHTGIQSRHGPADVKFSIGLTEEAFIVDLRWPIDAQLDRARDWALVRQKALVEAGKIEPPVRVNMVQTYSTYLRLLDGEAAGAGSSEMASVLFPDTANEYPDRLGDHKVREWLNKAREMRDRKYRFLVI